MRRQIRLATKEDAEICRDIYAHYIKNTAITFDYDIPTVEEYQIKIATILENHPFFVFEMDREVIGFAYGSSFRVKKAYQWSAETTIYLNKKRREEGAGSALYKALIYTMTKQGYMKLLAGVTLPNIQSVNFHLKFGFTPFSVQKRIGFKFDKWHDVQWLEKDLYDQPKKPQDIIPVWQILKNEETQLFFDHLHNSL